MYQVLIVEDEEWIRRGIIQSIDWLTLDMELAGEAENGECALNIIDTKTVDIILTDMKMPVCDGRGLLQGINDRKLDCEVIILSEYTDFEYTRQAIHAHVAEYLLKPIDPEQLNEVLLATSKRLKEKRLSYKIGTDPYDTVFRTAVARTSQAQLEAVCHRHKESFQNKYVVIAAMQTGFNQSDMPDFIDSLESFTKDAPYLTKLFPNHDNRNIVYLFTVAPSPYTAGVKRNYNIWLRGFFEKYKKAWGRDIRIGIGKELQDLACLRKSITEALSALKFLHFGLGDIIYFEGLENYRTTPQEILVSEQQIFDLLSHRKKDELFSLKETIILTLSQQEYVYLPTVRMVLTDFLLTLERCSSKASYALNITALMGENYIDRINRIEWLTEANVFLSEVLECVFQNIAAKQPLTTVDLIKEIIKHIETHYMDDINLMQFSQMYHINYVHLSRQFKERTGETFTDFLLRIRMTKAKTLIEDSGFDAKDVSMLVGYSNPYYFVTSYRKYFYSNKEEHANGTT